MEGHLNGFRLQETAVSHDEFRSTCPVHVEVECNLLVDHLAFAVAYPRHLDYPVARGDSEFGSPPEVQGDLSRWMTFLLGRGAMLGQEPPT